MIPRRFHLTLVNGCVLYIALRANCFTDATKKQEDGLVELSAPSKHATCEPARWCRDVLNAIHTRQQGNKAYSEQNCYQTRLATHYHFSLTVPLKPTSAHWNSQYNHLPSRCLLHGFKSFISICQTLHDNCLSFLSWSKHSNWFLLNPSLWYSLNQKGRGEYLWKRKCI